MALAENQLVDLWPSYFKTTIRSYYFLGVLKV